MSSRLQEFQITNIKWKKIPNINTHLIIVLVHQLPSLAVCSFGVHEVSNKSRHFLEVDNRRVKLMVMVLVGGDVGVLTILFSKSSFVKLTGKWALFVSLIMMFT